MLEERRRRRGEGLRKLADGGRAIEEPFHDRQPRRVGQRAEDPWQMGFIGSHMAIFSRDCAAGQDG